jgi:Helix-turn-helix domain
VKRKRNNRMAEQAQKAESKMVVQLTAEELRSIVAEAVQAAAKALPREDTLLKIEKVCEILNVKEEWVYHNAGRLPFVRKIDGLLRFSSNALQRYIEQSKFTVKGN